MNYGSKVSSLIFIVVGLLITSCQSKFSEPSPDQVNAKGLSLEDRVSQKKEVDVRLDEIQRVADKAKQIIEAVKKIQSPIQHENAYTPFDFIMEINEDFKTKIPQNSNGQLVRYGTIELPLQTLTEECRTVQTMLKSETVDSQEKLVYSLKTCSSKDQYVEIFMAQWNEGVVKLDFFNKNLLSILSQFSLAETIENTSCRIKQSPKKIIELISCESFDIKISASEKAEVKYLTFRNSGEIRLESFAKIFENGKLKATSEIRVFDNGEVKFDLKPIKTEENNESLN